MKKLTILIVWACYCLYFPAFGQTTTLGPYLHVGDKMPDMVISNVLNAREKTIDLAKLRGKVILLDFWNTFCSSCIEGFSDLDSLQHVYPDKLKVILVNPGNGDTRKGIDIVIKRTKSWSNYGFDLPIVFPGSSVTSLFKFRGVPHTIWIGEDGTIIAITGKEDVTSKNIALAINGSKLNLKEKQN
ncbi:TlpA family protein disulfide reductase [Mucilaginibacter sp. SMC90]|uniref:TlpA family protein disulfide reductase n=1 Tax=Mucilaginibacter sp. SMC90 TaxID=2929803 RepID=UPI001FB438B9|nr:TlpA disulfide reductase family protein [Mucilaginibacter sp. SMC90]UOE52556.1 TlpA family protein disulfide reductase [Mucilaginibacter sp. SMC90]